MGKTGESCPNNPHLLQSGCHEHHTTGTAFSRTFELLLFQGQAITTPEYTHLNLIIQIILIIFCIYILGFYGIYPIHIKFSRPALFFLGIALVIISQTILANDGARGIIIGDLFSVL